MRATTAAGFLAFAVLCALSCHTTSPREQARTAKAPQDCPAFLAASKSVRVTSNNDVVKGCKYLGNVTGREWADAIREVDIDHARQGNGPVMNARLTPDLCAFAGAKRVIYSADDVIRFSTATLGGDTVRVTGVGAYRVGEAYRCTAKAL